MENGLENKTNDYSAGNANQVVGWLADSEKTRHELTEET